jgi:hypothetical protein
MIKEFNYFLNFFIMKKQILNLGKALNKAEQKQINGGDFIVFDCNAIEGEVTVGCPCNPEWCAYEMICDTSQSSHLEGICVV